MDLNNRPGGSNLIVTAKTAHKVHFLDAATLTMASTIDMPGSTHELALSPDGRTAYGSVMGFAPGGTHAYLCCHDDAEVFEFELASGRVTRTFAIAAGCEFIVAYH